MSQQRSSAIMPKTYSVPSDFQFLLTRVAKELSISSQRHTRSDVSLRVTDWIEKHFYIPETSQPMVLADYQKRLLSYIFEEDPLPWTTVVWSETKKSGKSALAGAVARWWAETHESYNEVYCCANDFEQAQGRNYGAIRRSVELAADPRAVVLPEVRLNASRWRLTGRTMTYLGNGSFVQALSGDYRGAAGGNPGMIVFSELWGYVSEASRRLYGEMTTVPTRRNSFRWIETYAGWEGESIELENLYKLGVKAEPVPEFDDLRDAAGEPEVRADRAAGLFVFWSHTPRQPWLLGPAGQRYYASQRATLRAAEFRRFHRNEWTSREGGFIEAAAWDNLPHKGVRLEERLAQDQTVELVLAADASKNRDCTALVGVTLTQNPDNENSPFVDLAYVSIWAPTEDPEVEKVLVDLDETVGAELYRLASLPGVRIRCVAYDPYQLHSIMVTFTKKTKIDVEEIPQTEKRIQTDTNLSDLIKQKRLRPYFHAQLREHVLDAVAIERPRGIRLDKESTSKKIDGAVALSMASWACLFYGRGKKHKFVKV